MDSFLTTSTNTAATRLATRLAFLVAGFGIACWAPLVPLVKKNLAIDDGTLGLLLLCLGIGSLLSMALTGWLSGRFGCKPLIIGGGIGIAIILMLIPIITSTTYLAIALFVMGASLGAMDVSMNVHAVEVEKSSKASLMSGFHALFSVGGFAGAGAITLLLSSGFSPLQSCLFCALFMLITLVIIWPRLLRSQENHSSQGRLFILPKGIVLTLALLATSLFLVEGAILDWAALLLTSTGTVATTMSGMGYVLFNIAMTIGRLTGDAVTTRLGDRNILFWGSLLALLGFVLLLTSPIKTVALGSFLLIGLGASNIVPVLFRLAGQQKDMPSTAAIAAISLCGYTGVLAGPAAIGFIAHHIGLPFAFWILACLLLLVPLNAYRITRKDNMTL